VHYNDPHVPAMKKTRKYDFKLQSVALTKRNLKRYDCVLIATDHSFYDYDFIVEQAALVVDARNAVKSPHANVVKA
jgi:UDP-N-acetyl-D-glucosamine dehydrogenase